MGASPDGLLKCVFERKCIDIGQALSIKQKCLEGRRGSGFPGLRYRSGALFHSTSGRRLLMSPPTLRSIPQTTKPLQSLARCRTMACCPPFLAFRHSRSLGLELVPLRRADDGFVSLRHRQAASATPGPSQGLFRGSTSCLPQPAAQA